MKFPSPEELAQVPRSEIPALLAHLHALAGTLSARLLTEESDADDLLDVEEAAARLRKSTDWVYHKARDWPFTVRVGGKLLFSSRGLERYLRTKTGRRT